MSVVSTLRPANLRMGDADLSHTVPDMEPQIVANQTATFIASYLEAYEKLPSAADRRESVHGRAELDLEAAYQTMMMAAHDEQQSDSGGVDWFRVLRRALLTSLRRPSAKVVRVLYDVALFYLLAVSTDAGLLSRCPKRRTNKACS